MNSKAYNEAEASLNRFQDRLDTDKTRLFRARLIEKAITVVIIVVIALLLSSLK